MKATQYYKILPNVWKIDSWLWTCTNCDETFHEKDARRYHYCPMCGGQKSKLMVEETVETVECNGNTLLTNVTNIESN